MLHILLKQVSRDVSHELNNMKKYLIRLKENVGELFRKTRQTDHLIKFSNAFKENENFSRKTKI